MKVENTNLHSVKVLTPPTNFIDFRGSYVEIYNRVLFKEAGITIDFIQDDISTSKKNVLRGIHGDQKTWKLISCLYGSFYLVVLDMDPASPTYKKWQGFDLSDANRLQVLVPPKHGNGHLVLSEMAIFHYKQNTEYDRAGQFTVLWNEPEYKIKWPIENPILSKRDDGTEKA